MQRKVVSNPTSVDLSASDRLAAAMEAHTSAGDVELLSVNFLFSAHFMRYWTAFWHLIVYDRINIVD